MSSDWEFVDVCETTTRNRLTPPSRVRELVVTESELYDERVHWYYDTEVDLAVISNRSEQDLVSFGYSELADKNKSVTPDEGLIDTAFDSVIGKIEPDTTFVFIGKNGVLNQDNCNLYLIHEEQFYNLFPDVDSLKKLKNN